MDATDLATWAGLVVGIAGVFVAVFAATAPALNSHQRRLRGELRDVLSALRDVPNHYKLRSNERVAKLNASSVKLSQLQREGLLSPDIRELSAAIQAVIAGEKAETATATKADPKAAAFKRDLDEYMRMPTGRTAPTGPEKFSIGLRINSLADDLYAASVKMDNGDFITYYKCRGGSK